MQNVDSIKAVHTEEENLDLAEGPTSLCSIPEAAAAPSHSAVQEGVQSDPETRPKVKTRSRFSSALRRLSRSSKKKDNPPPLEVPEVHPLTEAVISSGGEETGEPNSSIEAKPKKKSKLSKRFLLGSLKKSKISPKKSLDAEGEPESEPEPVLTESQTVHEPSEEKDIKPAKDSDSSAFIPQRLDRIRKVQITISGKKIEQTTTTITDKQPLATCTEIPGALNETDYLTPTKRETPKATQSASTVVVTAPVKEASASAVSPKVAKALSTEATDATAKKKKLKLKKIATSIRTTTQSQKRAPATAAQTTPTTEEEKFVITQTTRDTPPRERAPAKPSRIAVSPSSQATASTGAVRKISLRTAATITSPTITQQRPKSDLGALAVKRPTRPRIATAGTSTDQEIGLMQNPQNTLERGHRFPRPTPANGNGTPAPAPALTETSTSTTEAEVTAATNQQQQRQRQIQFQLQSHASQSQSLSPTPPIQEEQHQQPQSLQSNDYLQPPSYPPPPVPVTNVSNTATPETRSPAHRHPSSNTVTAESATLHYIEDESVATASCSGADEVVSSAESAQPSEYSGNNIRNPHVAGHGLSPQDSQRTLKSDWSVEEEASSTVSFAVGSAVRPQGTSIDTLNEQTNTFGSNPSSFDSDSQSPVSESSRRRIQYVAQPTLFDEFKSLERRREVLRYQTGISELSLDSEYDSGDNQMPAFGDLTMDQDMEPTIMTSANTEKREHLYKILVIGELGTGKTSFIKRYVHQFFSQNYRATIGVDFALKVLHWDANTIVRLQLWDIAGQERFGNMTRVYYKEAVGAFIVFDVTRSGTFDCVAKWKEDLDSKVQLPDGSPIPCILLANKSDQEKQGIVTTPEKMDEYVRENGFAGWYETSAKENINIDEAARALVNKILLNDKLINAADLDDSERFNLDNTGDSTVTETKNKCSC